MPCSVSCCCIVHSNLLLRCAQQSAAALRMAICFCVTHGNPLLYYAWQSAVSRAAMCQGQLMAQAMVMQWMYTVGCNMVRTPYWLPPRALPVSNLQMGAEKATTAKSEMLVLEAKSSAWSGLETPPPLSILQEALIEGMCWWGFKAPLM